LFGRPGIFSLSGSNLNQGWSWADSTAVSNTVLVTAASQLELSKQFSVGAEGMRALTQLDAGAGEWYYALSASRKGKVWFSTALRYDKYRFESVPVLGGTIDLMLPIGSTLNLRLNAYYRPESKGELPSTNPAQFFSQQSLEAIF
ncbi:MAG: hypothetical protein AAGF89_13960, partial [Bacteroidota bacterium]